MNSFARKLAVVVGGAVVSAGFLGAAATPADAAVHSKLGKDHSAIGKDHAAAVKDRTHSTAVKDRLHAVTVARADSSWPC